MNKFIIALVASFALILSGCAVNEVTFPVDGQKVRSILVPPAINESNEAVADNMLTNTISYRLSERGYYVFPVNTISMILQHEGLFEAEKIQQKPTSELCDMFKADTVLFTKILNWESVYGVFSTKTYVKIQYTLVDKDGNQLFSKIYDGAYDPSGRNDSVMAMITNMIVSAVERSAPSYFYAADQANVKMTTSNFGPGHYLIKYLQTKK
mgnify:CR=1 FL=1